ncbi:MAG: hypothetical protein ACTHKC_08375 [Candidatus Nitrosocosmicus sp.]
MNIAQIETPFEIEAKACGCKSNKRVISYQFIESSHRLCIDKREILLAQIQACERLLKHTKDDDDSLLVKREISELKLALDLVHY